MGLKTHFSSSLLSSESSVVNREDLESSSVNSSTATPQPVLINSACFNYTILDSVSRNVATPEADSVCSGGCCDQKGNAYPGPDWKGTGWYR